MSPFAADVTSVRAATAEAVCGALRPALAPAADHRSIQVSDPRAPNGCRCTGIGSDVAKRIAAPMWGGLVSLTLLTLLVIPDMYVVWRGF